MNAADNATRIAAQKIAAGAQIAAARLNKEGYIGAAQKQLDAIDRKARESAFATAVKSMAGNDKYRQALLKGDTKTMDALIAPVFNTLYSRYKNAGSADGAGEMPGMPALPEGYEED